MDAGVRELPCLDRTKRPRVEPVLRRRYAEHGVAGSGKWSRYADAGVVEGFL